MVTIRHERTGDAAAREQLLDVSYGPVRFTKTSERLREGRLPEVALVATEGRRVVGSVRLWPVSAGPGRHSRCEASASLEPRGGLLLLGRLAARAAGAARRRPARPWRRAAGRRRALLCALRLLQREDRRALAAGTL